MAFYQKSYFYKFLRTFLYSYKNLNVFFYTKLKLRGLGFRFRRLFPKFYRAFIGYTNYIYIHCPENFVFKIRRLRVFILVNDLNRLRTIVVHFLLLRELSPYKLSGIFFPRQIILLKPGKKRF